tara:strand:+ start:626 stop:1363 length:738 start_codon:yes stop_codon:yes gene_type:complete
MGIELGTVSGNPKKLELDTSNQVYLGNIQVAETIERAYIKRLTSEKIVIEYVVARLANEVGLNSPNPIIGIWNDEYVFASKDLKSPSIFALLVTNKTFVNIVWDKWKKKNEAACFDEWIKNPDRNQQNILIKGSGQIYLIDHEKCLCGDFNIPSYDNGIINTLTAALNKDDELGKRRLLKDLEKPIPNFRLDFVNQITSELKSANIISDTYEDEMLKFFEQRLSVLSLLIEQQLGMKQMGLVYNG